MARILGSDAEVRFPLEQWRHLRVVAGSFDAPAGLPEAGWQPFAAPALFGPDAEGRLAEADDHWLIHRLERAVEGRLVFEGLATSCDVFIEGVLRTEHRSMFVPLVLDGAFPAGTEIALRFHALEGALKAAPRRSRWRPMMIEPNGLRYLRTTALGSMDGWTPEGRPTGPYRDIYALPRNKAGITSGDLLACDLTTDYRDGAGHVSLRLVLREGVNAQTVTLTCAGHSTALPVEASGAFSGALTLAGIAPWWPHTHGEPALHAVTLTIDGTHFDLGKTGFRRIEVDRGTDGCGFGLLVNGEPVFCRGAVWMTPDAARLPGGREDYAPLIGLARAAGMTMLRVPGVGVYESHAFFELCDEAGILVMQDVMLANFDYPQADDGFCAALEAEVSHLLASTQIHPSLALLCGGSEVFQQAAMLGAPPEDWAGPVFEEMLPRLVKAHRPDLAYVGNSPSGGALPFVVEEGIGHYFGVGAYCRPLEDARRANVRFASECLAFANVPRDPALMTRGVPRDAGADWDFADVRNHYARLLFGEAVQDDARAHAIAEATSAHVMETTLHEWRRPASPTRGALVLALSNLMPGAGWGVIDENGIPKAAYYGLKRASQPLHLGLTDEGVNGLHLHLANETGTAFEGEIQLVALREGKVVVAEGRRPVTLAPRTSISVSAFTLLGQFFDLTYAYRFGALQHDSVVARLVDRDGAVLREAFFFPDMAAIVPVPLDLSARLDRDGQGWYLDIATERVARFVGIRSPGAAMEDHRFHLAPGRIRRLRFGSSSVDAAAPHGIVSALNGLEEIVFGC
ncbi:MAG: glycoside hydrolase family 2 protein [Proteobacteria bacterium]|nr:glycoside hydrolase family 2 protein [Pseudomonadota bacterium]